MKNAKEIRDITNKVLEERKASQIKIMNDYIEEVIAPKVEEKALQGESMLTIEVDVTRVIGISELAKTLSNNGYSITFGVKYPMLKIHW